MQKMLYYGLWGMFLLLFMTVIMRQVQVIGPERGLKAVIDRFERDYAVVELPDNSMVNLPLKLLKPEIQEGDVIHISVLKTETRTRKHMADRLLLGIFE